MKRVFIIAFVCVCILGPPSTAFAQSGSGRPFRGLFGGSNQRDGQRQTLDLSATLVEAYDDHLLAELGSPRDEPVSGYYTTLNSNARYSWAGPQVRFGLSGNSAWRYYGSSSEVAPVGHSVAARLAAPLRPGTNFSLNQDAYYRPAYRADLLLVEANDSQDRAPTTGDVAISDVPSYGFATTAAIAQNLSRRSMLSATADYRFTGFIDESNRRRDRSSAGIRTGWSHRIRRNTSLTAGYSYRRGDGVVIASSGTTLGKTAEHGPQFGIVHTPVLSATRRAHFQFGMGVSVINAPSLTVQGATTTRRFYRLSTDASVMYPFARNWEGRVAYRRGLEYVAELVEPVFTDNFRGIVEGFVSRRVDLLVLAAYNRGGSVLSTDGPVLSTNSRFDTYIASVRSRIALTEHMAGYVEYLYQFYEFGRLLAPGLPPEVERNSVRAGLTLWVRPVER
jgi:hypothetical protein